MRVRTGVADELERSDLDLWIEWTKAVASLPKDPFGASIVTSGKLTFMHVHGMPKPYYNRVIGLSESTASRLSEALGFFAERMTPCRVDVLPRTCGSALLGALNDRGLRPTEFQSNLFARIEDVPVSAHVPGVSVTEVSSGQIGFFARLYERAYYGTRVPRGLARFRRATITARATRPGWRFYLANVEGVPAGGAALFFKDGVATLAGGATIFTLRGRGVQRALLLRRIEDSRRLGARMLVSRCVAGSVSQRNMERVGLTVSYTKSIWEHPPV